MRVTEPQRQLLHTLMLDDEPNGDVWAISNPAPNMLTVRSCEAKGLVEVSERGIRLTDEGRAFLSSAR